LNCWVHRKGLRRACGLSKPGCRGRAACPRSAGWTEACARGRQVQFWAPQASGAGVSLIMAYLNGNAIPDLLSLRALVAKFSGAPPRGRNLFPEPLLAL
jgi:hypothetical protein